jgi:CRISPR system Cascade subunit CasB
MTEKSFLSFAPEDDSSRVLVMWWEALDGYRGQRAALRRAKSPIEVHFFPVFHQLLNQLREKGYRISSNDSERLALIGGLAAHVKKHVSTASLAKQMATTKSSGGGARVSGLRFRRLLAISGRDELYPFLIRVVRLLDGTVNLVSMAYSVYWWNERVKKEWAYDYYATAPNEP